MFLFKNITKGKQKENIKRMKFDIFINFLHLFYNFSRFLVKFKDQILKVV